VGYVRTVRTSSGAVAVQVVWKYRHGSRDIEHLGSADTDAAVEVLKAVAAQRIAAGQDELPIGVPAKQQLSRWRSPPHGWAGCWMSSRLPTGSSGSMRPLAETRWLSSW
jgi:hypothetical protein